jgi:hypothetical protein
MGEMAPRTASERNRPPRSGLSLAGRNAALGTLCLVLCVELTLAARLLLETVTGKSWFVVSLAAGFLAVALLYGKLEACCGLDAAPARAHSPSGSPPSGTL